MTIRSQNRLVQLLCERIINSDLWRPENEDSIGSAIVINDRLIKLLKDMQRQAVVSITIANPTHNDTDRYNEAQIQNIYFSMISKLCTDQFNDPNVPNPIFSCVLQHAVRIRVTNYRYFDLTFNKVVSQQGHTCALFTRDLKKNIRRKKKENEDHIIRYLVMNMSKYQQTVAYGLF